MSTFKGVVSEFPGIRVDFFRQLPDSPPPLASFLSHVHSDHLAGLETFKSTFIYCSAATREILLRLEKSSIRLNHARGILEGPRRRTYRHLSKRLKPIPLDTPTSIELGPGRTMQVTLLDANHCVGAVMFLFEGFGKAVLYTGDIRCEPRLVTAITQNPNMIEYSSGWKILDRIYLDTSVLDDYPLQPKAAGLRELLEKVRQYPDDTIFHLQAWTYGYEEVWIALSRALNSKIHVDEYKMRVFGSLVNKPKEDRWAAQTHLAKEAPALVGFTCGNNQQEGCLTLNEDVRIHSCEKGMGCSVMETKPVVWIRPIVTHLKNGQDVMEVGIGGGGEDLTQTTTLTPEDILWVLEQMSTSDTLPAELHPYMHTIKKALGTERDINLIADSVDLTEEEFPQLLKLLFHKLDAMRDPIKQTDETAATAPLPNTIRFPYARHSSLPELRDFVSAFTTSDIVPCTFDAEVWLQKEWSIRGLFGDLVAANEFEYDEILELKAKELAVWKRDPKSRSQASQKRTNSAPSPKTPEEETVHVPDTIISISSNSMRSQERTLEGLGSASPILRSVEPHKRGYDSFLEDTNSDDILDLQDDSRSSSMLGGNSENWQKAFNIMIANINGEPWQHIGLISTTDNHTTLEQELGSL